MITRYSQYIQSRASGRRIVALFLVMMAFILLTLPMAEEASAGIEGLDSRGFYSLAEAHSTVASYSAKGRESLKIFYLTVDVINPLLYASFFALLISWVFQRAFSADSRLQRLNLVPLAAILFDLLENTSIVRLFAAFPSQPDSIARLAQIGSAGKFSLVSFSAVLILMGLMALAWKRLRGPEGLRA